MKKIIFTLLFCFLFIIPVYAEQCRVVSGTGKQFGDEISCGTEHFYVLENKDNQTYLLAKYNLNVGDKIDYFDVEDNALEYVNINSLIGGESDNCRNLAISKGYNPYYTYPMPKELENGMIGLKGCRVYERMNEEYVRQDPRAIGTRIVDGKSVLPLYDITYMEPRWGYESKVNNNIPTMSYSGGASGDLVVEGTPFEDYLNGYKSELERQGIGVESVSFVTLNRIINILETISGRTVEYNMFFPEIADDGIEVSNEEQYSGKMDIKEYISEQYSWIYSVTYWLGSGYTDNDSLVKYRDYYISNEGMLCALGRGECIVFVYPIGNGVRPMVTIASSNIIDPFSITTETDGNGSIDVANLAYENDVITFRVTPKTGYKISKIKVTTKTGEVITFTEDDIVENEDGTVSINSFTMPAEDVTIEAIFSYELINPKTGQTIPYTTMIILMLMSVIYVVWSKRKLMSLN